MRQYTPHHFSRKKCARSGAGRCYNKAIMGRRNGITRARRGREETVRQYDTLIRYASAIILVAAGILLILAIFGAAGPVGNTAFTLSYAIVGIGTFLLP